MVRLVSMRGGKVGGIRGRAIGVGSLIKRKESIADSPLTNAILRVLRNANKSLQGPAIARAVQRHSPAWGTKQITRRLNNLVAAGIVEHLGKGRGYQALRRG